MPTGPTEGRQLAQERVSVQAYARTAGVLALLSLIAGGFGEAYAPSRIIVSTDAAATVGNLKALDFLFRMGFAAYLIEAICDITLALVLYVLLKPVHRYLSLLATFFGLVGTAVFGAAELFYFAPTLLLRGTDSLKGFSPDQLNTLALLSLKLYVLGGAIFTAFYGAACVVRGYLIFRSGYLPKALGVLLTIAGVAFVVRNFALVLAPAYPSGGLLLLILPGFLAMTVWFLVKGVDVAKWEARAATRD